MKECECFFSSMSSGLEGTVISSAITVVDIKPLLLYIGKCSCCESLREEGEVFCLGLVAVQQEVDFPLQGSQGPLNTGSAAALPFLFGSGSKITLNLI